MKKKVPIANVFIIIVTLYFTIVIYVSVWLDILQSDLVFCKCGSQCEFISRSVTVNLTIHFYFTVLTHRLRLEIVTLCDLRFVIIVTFYLTTTTLYHSGLFYSPVETSGTEVTIIDLLRGDAPINGVFLFILIIFHFPITLAVFQSNLCSSQNFPCHEKDTECVFGFALAQNAQIISRLEPITSMFAFPNPGCNSSLSALGCNTTLTSIANTQLNTSLSSTVDL